MMDTSGLRKTKLQNAVINSMIKKQLPYDEREIKEYSTAQCKRKLIELNGKIRHTAGKL